MIKTIKVTKAFKSDIEKHKKIYPTQIQKLANVLQELTGDTTKSFLGISANNRKEYHMESGLLFIYRVDNDILYLERFGPHNELFNT